MGKLREKFLRFMLGRYGIDDLGRVMVYVSLALLILSMFIRHRIFYILAVAVLAYTYFRMFSKNISRRYAENQKFTHLKYRVLGKHSIFKSRRYDKEYRYFSCPACKQKVRVPRGKGKISIHCPKCHADFIKRT